MSTLFHRLGSIVYHGETGTATRQSAAGHAGYAHSADAALWSRSRTLHRQAYPTDDERLSADAARIALDLFSYDLYRRFQEVSPEFEQLAAVQAGGTGFTVRWGSAPATAMRAE
jgi:hypothetical protein